ncbi:hypothetical protein Aab01nite_06950 [Paractinoplanes abujensis]|uniref:Uncharacterized protein n=1 Tax=Paractinoplanes abujensis TaxID=882441 RepID=A0A7W7G0S3_9ACTN|nr:hypothetical protein [Actinoplanes abujensis]MBB4691480.1 hypothetical protein [Actinoplanes abujensis]GID17105.1 hypothetical protein Aab01nite_06950 [Actinoplanes abujensis]
MTDDDDLRSRLRRTDPAARMTPAAPEHIAQLLEKTMTTATVRPRFDTRLLTMAAAALVLIAAVGGFLITRGTGAPDEPSGPGRPVAAPTVTDLAAPPGANAKCVEPSAAKLKEYADFAFAGTVTGINRGAVTLAVTHVYLGRPVDEVRVAQEGYSSETLLGSGRFEQGLTYLVAASEGGILVCGYSGEASAPGLRELYDEAF